MTLLVYYTLIFLVLCAGSVGIGLGVERIWEPASMPAFLGLFFVSLWVGWIIAVRLTEPKPVSAPFAGAPSDQRA